MVDSIYWNIHGTRPCLYVSGGSEEVWDSKNWGDCRFHVLHHEDALMQPRSVHNEAKPSPGANKHITFRLGELSRLEGQEDTRCPGQHELASEGAMIQVQILRWPSDHIYMHISTCNCSESWQHLYIFLINNSACEGTYRITTAFLSCAAFYRVTNSTRRIHSYSCIFVQFSPITSSGKPFQVSFLDLQSYYFSSSASRLGPS